jgi:ornithine--oxo-acid transaminase
MVEPIQAEAGIVVPPAGYLTEVKRICREQRVLLILDEIQTGLGRTGKLFDYQHEADAKPDVLVLGKALGGGIYPVSAVLASAEVMGLIKPGDHGSTFGGNPLAAAVGEAALEVVIESRLAVRAQELGKHLFERLSAIRSPHVVSVRGRGLLAGIEITRASGSARSFAEKLLDRGVLCKDTHEQVIRLAPPLIVQKDQLDWLVEQLRFVLEKS